VLAEARDEDVLEFVSVAGLPARAVNTPWLQNYLQALPRLEAKTHKKPRCTLAWDCLAQCGLRDGLPGWGQFCIDTQLAAALRGDVKKGLFFRGVGTLPFGQRIVSVPELIERLLTPAAAPYPLQLGRSRDRLTQTDLRSLGRRPPLRRRKDRSGSRSYMFFTPQGLERHVPTHPGSVDGSRLTDRAISASIDLARQLGAAITGFVAEPVPEVPDLPSSPSGMLGDAETTTH
jgi:hypothetical protein